MKKATVSRRRTRATPGLALLVIAVGAGCGSGYAEGRLLAQGPSLPSPRARQLGCLDVRVQALEDGQADRSWAVVAFDFGNRCDAPARVDLGRAVVTAAYAHRAPSALHPYDPGGEIGPGRIDGRAMGREVIAWVGPPGVQDPPAWLCVHLEDITDRGRARPVCFDRRVEGGVERWRVR